MTTIQRTNQRKGRGGYRIDVDPAECVLWDGNVNKPGYGRMWVETSDGNRSLRYAHRVAWEVWRSPIPAGMTIDHLCVNSLCVNPNHLDLVTLAENSRRANARVSHCPKRHEYTEENTGISSQGNRFCRECHRARANEYYKRRHDPKGPR